MMLRMDLLASSLALVVGTGCGGSTVTTTSSGSGGDTTSSSSGGSGGSGGAGTSTGTSNGGGGTTSASTSNGGGNAGGAGGCMGRVDLTIDNEPLQKLGSTCNGYASSSTDTAEGFAFAGGPVDSPHGIRIVGCTTDAPMALGVVLSAFDANGPGTYGTGFSQFVDGNGDTWGVDGDPFMMTLTTVEPTGGVIEGTFSVITSHGGNAAHSLAGSFHVCHVTDQLAP